MPALRDDLRREIPRLLDAGLNGKQVAERVGCSPHTVVRVRRELGLVRPSPEPSPKAAAPPARTPGFMVAAQRAKTNARDRFAETDLVCMCAWCGFRTPEVKGPEAVAALRSHVCDGA